MLYFSCYKQVYPSDGELLPCDTQSDQYHHQKSRHLFHFHEEGDFLHLSCKQKKIFPSPDYFLKLCISTCGRKVTMNSGSLADNLLAVELDLSNNLKTLPYNENVSYIYDPVHYAYSIHSNFIYKFCCYPKKILFIGMNPGPWGMSQTGVPFGEVTIVRDWFQVSGSVHQPERQHSSRPVLGLECHRSEPSGRKFWGFFKNLCGNPYYFFQNAFIYNYCPLAFLSTSGKNITPAEFKAEERRRMNILCNEALYKILTLLRTEIIIAIGRYAEERVNNALQEAGVTYIQVLYIPHPSPRNLSCKNWEEDVMKQLTEFQLLKYFIPLLPNTEEKILQIDLENGT